MGNKPYSERSEEEKAQRAAWGLEWRRRNPEKVAEYAKTQRLRRYGLKAGDPEALTEAQGGLCAVCFKPKELVVDHDHATNEVRGMLCNNCNSLLGFAYDNPALLRQAARYLEGAR